VQQSPLSADRRQRSTSDGTGSNWKCCQIFLQRASSFASFNSVFGCGRQSLANPAVRLRLCEYGLCRRGHVSAPKIDQPYRKRGLTFFCTCYAAIRSPGSGLIGQIGSAVVAYLWREWCWSWNSSTLATSCEKLTHWKRLWCWEGLRAGGEGDARGWDSWMASLTWTWVWVNSGSLWWTGRPGMLRFMGLQRAGHDWATTELNWTEGFQEFDSFLLIS